MSKKEKQKKEPAVLEKETTQEDVVSQDKDYKAMFLRVSADYQNFKRRAEKEKSVWIRTAQASILNSFLPIIDDIDRAMNSCKKEHEELASESWFGGFELIQKNLQKILTDLQVSEIDCSGAFDPHSHEALMHIDSEKHESGQIVEVINKGYLFNGEVLRHAKVSVAK